MRAKAKSKKAYFIGLVFSVTKRNFRKPCNQEMVLSATQRNTPRPLPCLVFRWANFGSTPR
jgi:hypothetical protein